MSDKEEDEELRGDGIEIANKKKSKKKKRKKTLDNPFRKRNPSIINPTCSVFYNPFLKEQEDKNRILEKHVKLTTNTKDVIEINGKKICWNYRKGKCRFGHNCKYAHDSDLINGISSDNNISGNNSLGGSSCGLVDDSSSFLSTNSGSSSSSTKRKKSGLTEGLVPGKRSRKNFDKIQSQEKPWLTQR